MDDRRRGPRKDAPERRHPLRAKARLRPAGPAIERRERVRMTVKLPEDVLERLRSAVHSTPGLTVAAFIERCISNGVDGLERRRGRKFRPYKGTLRAGRPKSAK
jgi:hypothetical protein